MLVAAKLLVTLGVVGCAVVPLAADLNATHARNPLWTGHARYHVVWQSMSYMAIGAVALVLLWAPGPLTDREALYLAAALAGCVYFGFFAALASRRLYGGRLHDRNGHRPARIVGRAIDQNLLLFVPLTLLLCAGVLLAILA